MIRQRCMIVVLIKKLLSCMRDTGQLLSTKFTTPVDAWPRSSRATLLDDRTHKVGSRLPGTCDSLSFRKASHAAHSHVGRFSTMPLHHRHDRRRYGQKTWV